MSDIRVTLPYTGHTGWVRSVAYASDGATVLTGGSDGTARIWDARTGEQRLQLTGHTGPMDAVAYAPDGATVLTGGDVTIRIWNARSGAQVDGTGFGVARRIGRPLAGIRSDVPSARDLIGAAPDVETLADLIAAAETSAPLAIALIGDWGTGKSSVMLQVQERIDFLAEMSRNNPGLSVFVSNVRQVRFNAWDYSDDQLWSGLVGHLFGALAAAPADSPPALTPGTIEGRRAGLRRELAEEEAAAARLGAGLRAADGAVRPQGLLAWLSSPAYAWRILAAAVRELAHEGRVVPWVLLGWAVLGGAACGIWAWLGPRTGVAAAALAAVLAPAAAAGRQLQGWHRAGTGATDRLRRRLDQRQRDLNQKIAGLREQLALIDASARLSAFLSERAAPTAYQQYRGLLGQVRSDLAELSADLAAARREWLISEAATPPPLERIVLYIDDLDRCSPRRVVEVLEAVHLMLAMDLFVVVVAVDARWLIQSLECHYREFFGTGTDTAPAAGSQPEHDHDSGPASPVDYLDKIFQIPYALVPPAPAAMATYLRSLMPSASRPEPQPAETASTAGTRPAGTQASADDSQESHETHTGNPAHQLAGKPALREEGKPFTPAASWADATIPDLRPLGLQLSQPEVDFMTRLAALVPTARAAKRLVNLYRLVRIVIPDSELAAFTSTDDGQFQAVQVLLALLAGSPAAAQHIFRELMNGPPEGDILELLDRAANADIPESRRCAQIRAELSRISDETRLPTAAGHYQRWCPVVARYSFRTRQISGQHPSPGS